MRDIRVEEVAETLREARDNADGCCLLIGAGCSVTAGIPTAAGLVEDFARRWPSRYEALEEKTYMSCMARLAREERRRFIAPFIDAAKVNWAHIAIAHLMKCGYITRILTTNFDPLIVQACSMVGVFPAVYDLASSKIFKPEQVRDPSIFYLHGQRLGFVMLSTQDEVGEHLETLAPVFQRAGEGRVWIVAGYSGLNDPVFEHLAAVSRARRLRQNRRLRHRIEPIRERELVGVPAIPQIPHKSTTFGFLRRFTLREPRKEISSHVSRPSVSGVDHPQRRSIGCCRSRGPVTRSMADHHPTGTACCRAGNDHGGLPRRYNRARGAAAGKAYGRLSDHGQRTAGKRPQLHRPVHEA